MVRTPALVAIAALVAFSSCGGSDSEDESLEVGTSSNNQIRECLAGEGFQAQLLKAPPGDTDAPSHELNFLKEGEGPEAGGQIALYESESAAQRLLPEIEENVAGFDGKVEQSGRITLVWFTPEPDSEIRKAVVDCLS